MEIAILGPLEARDDSGGPIEIAGARLRALLARLALDAGRPVSPGALASAVWGDALPAAETNALQTLVSRLRRALGRGAPIAQSAAGYQLDLAAGSVDANRFERGAEAGAAALREGHSAQARVLLDEALELWRGPALADVGDGLLDAARRLEDRRLAARLDRAEAALAGGDSDGVLGELTELAEADPLDERVAATLMRALARSGREADALRIFDLLRRRLADELGVDPSAELRSLHLELLRGRDTPAPRRTNLKAQLTSFVGRDGDVARLGKSLEGNRLITLVGPGGAGKTRLAAEAAARIVDTAPDGVWLVELATVTDGADVAQAALGAVGSREIHLMERPGQASVRDALTRLLDGLAEKRAVLLLDNCEHVIEASARLAEQLLGACPQLRIVATSREPLGITGETLLAVAPLAQPAPTATAIEAWEYPAVRLFADRAGAVSPDFAVSGTTVALIIEIVRRLDGLPLAIELAAARLRSMPLDDIAARLSDRFRLLTGASRTALPRHRTLRAVVEWSWELLEPAERSLVECLAVFPAGITAASAAAARPAHVEAADVPDVLAALVDKSLLQQVGDGHRLRMLETIREYGVERLGERGELAGARARHADHFAAVLAEAEPHLTTSGQLPWFALLTAERENFVAALRYRCDIEDADGALEIAVPLAGFAMMLGEHADIAGWMSDALAVAGAADPDLLITARAMHALNVAAMGSIGDSTGVDLAGIAVAMDDMQTAGRPVMALLRPAVAFFARDAERTKRFMDESLACGDDWARAAAMMLRANLAENDGDIAAMRVDIEGALAEFRRLGERWGMASALRTMAGLHLLDGELQAATEAYEQALSLTREMGSRDDELYVYSGLAEIAVRRGDHDSAMRHMARARESADERRSGIESVFTLAVLGDLERRLGLADEARAHVAEAVARLSEITGPHPGRDHIRAMVLGTAGRIALDDGDLDLACGYAREAYAAARLTDDLPIMAAVGMFSVQAAASAGRHVEAALLLGAAARLRGADDPTSPDVRDLTARLRAELGDEVFEREYAAGRTLTREDAIARLDPDRPT